MDKATLRQYQFLVKEIEQLEEEKLRLSASLVGAVNITDMPHGSRKVEDRMAEVAVKMSDIAQMIADKLNQLYDLRQQIEQAIEELEPRERVLMRERYIEGKKWEQIAVDMGYCYMQICRIHGEILKKM